MPNNQNRIHKFTLRFPKNTADKIKFIAKYNARTANKEIERLVLFAISNFERKYGEITMDDLLQNSDDKE